MMLHHYTKKLGVVCVICNTEVANSYKIDSELPYDFNNYRCVVSAKKLTAAITNSTEKIAGLLWLLQPHYYSSAIREI